MDAVLDLMPLDYFVESAAEHMAPQDGAPLPDAGAEVIEAAATTVAKHADGISLDPVDRFEFYSRARKCYAVVQTMERRPYGNVILTKGVVGPDGLDLKP
jgi:L-fucose mutarotase